MNPSEKKIICFQVNDKCNFNCTSCHWFSKDVSVVDPPSYKMYLAFLDKINWVDRVVLSGGEPTLWDELSNFINGVRNNVGEITIYTNGSNPTMLQKIENKENIYIRLSIHKETNWKLIKQTLRLILERSWNIKVYAFEASMPEKIPSWFYLNIKFNKEQSCDGFLKYSNLLGQQIFCQPRMLYFGTDGESYCCEKGLRSKNKKYSMGFSLDDGTVHASFRQCLVDEDCLGCFDTEQYIKIGNEISEQSAWSDEEKIINSK